MNKCWKYLKSCFRSSEPFSVNSSNLICRRNDNTSAETVFICIMTKDIAAQKNINQRSNFITEKRASGKVVQCRQHVCNGLAEKRNVYMSTSKQFNAGLM